MEPGPANPRRPICVFPRVPVLKAYPYPLSKSTFIQSLPSPAVYSSFQLLRTIVKMMLSKPDPRGLLAVLLLVAPALAHGGHENVPEGAAISGEPIVRALNDRLISSDKTDGDRTRLYGCI